MRGTAGAIRRHVHKDKGGLNVYYHYQRIKPLTSKAIGETSHLREETRKVYVDFSRPVYKMAIPTLTRNKIQQEYTTTTAQN